MHRLVVLVAVLALLATGFVMSSRSAEADNEFVGDIPTSGVGLGVWSGGDVANVGPAVASAGCTLASTWATVDGALVPYISGAPDIVNADFLDTFEGSTIPPNTALIIVCAEEAAGEPPEGSAPPTALPTPPASAVTFGDGVHVVGTDVPPGRYRTTTIGNLCYWVRLSGFGGTLDELIANDLAFGGASAVVDIVPGDIGFESSDCGAWSSDLSPVTASPTAPFGDGAYIVNVDIAPGIWQSAGGKTCYWSRLAGFSGELADILLNDLPDGHAVVTIAPTDVGFETSGCGEWTPA